MTSELHLVFVTLSCTVLIALYYCVDEMRILIRKFNRMGGEGVGYVGCGGVGIGIGGGGGDCGADGCVDTPQQMQRL